MEKERAERLLDSLCRAMTDAARRAGRPEKNWFVDRAEGRGGFPDCLALVGMFGTASYPDAPLGWILYSSSAGAGGLALSVVEGLSKGDREIPGILPALAGTASAEDLELRLAALGY